MAALAVLSLTATAVPAFADPAPIADLAEPKPVSAWGKGGAAKMPEVKVGQTEPAAPVAEGKLPEKRAKWRAAQKKRATEPTPTAARSAGIAADAQALAAYVPEGQGDVPWHQIGDFRITDSLVARVDYSTGNLMLAGTDFDVAGVGQSLQLARTYNSLDAPWGWLCHFLWMSFRCASGSHFALIGKIDVSEF
ncbi:DUF6531 domain-containing protein [Streptomyces sp. H27-C3]|uniref:DUF6531 domain-containing protein n=1 Tax=Streptomyces sp. H27-C3 TaxID=3046305 RepID=UPI0032D8B816